MNRPNARTTGILLVAALVAAALAWGFKPKPLLVETAQLRVAPMELSVEEEGRTRVKERYAVYAPVDGYLRRIELEAGDAVEAGQVVAELDPLRSGVLDPRSRAEADARARAARSALQRAENQARQSAAEADLARQEYERRQDLLERKLISRSEFDQAQSRYRAAQAAAGAAESAVQVARYELDATEAVLGHSAASESGDAVETVMLRSPVTGNVLARLRESEGVVSAGTPLLELGDPRQLEVEVEVLSPDAVRIQPGGRVLFERWGGGEPLAGVVRTVEPRGFTKVSALGVEEQRVLVIADLASPPQEWQALGDGYRVEARFVVWESPDALVLPSSALFRRDGGWVVYRVGDGRARLTPVRIGHNNGLDAEVLDGLQAGDRVIVHPGDDLDDGARVEPYTQTEEEA